MLINLQVSHSELSDRVEYLLHGHSGERAPDKVEVLYGNGELFKTLGKTNPYKVKSFNFLISFHENREELERKLRKKGKTIKEFFEEILDELLPPDLYPRDSLNIFAVSHSDTDHYHIHLTVENRDYLRDKALYIPNTKTEIRFYRALEKYFSAKYGLDYQVSPYPSSKITKEKIKSVLEERGKRKGKTRDEIKEELTELLAELVVAGVIDSREDLITYLESIEGVEVKRIGKSYISIDYGGFRIRLKGGIYDEERFREFKDFIEGRERSLGELERAYQTVKRKRERQLSQRLKRGHQGISNLSRSYSQGDSGTEESPTSSDRSLGGSSPADSPGGGGAYIHNNRIYRRELPLFERLRTAGELPRLQGVLQGGKREMEETERLNRYSYSEIGELKKKIAQREEREGGEERALSLRTSSVLSFLSSLGFSPEDRVCLLFVNHKENKAFQRFYRVSELESRFLSLLELNDSGYSVYFTVNRLLPNARSRKIGDFYPKQRLLYFDIDGDKDPEALERFKSFLEEFGLPRPTLLVQTSETNYQAYYVLKEEEDFSKLQELMKFVNERCSFDHTHDIARVFRLPPFANRKPGKDFWVRVVEQGAPVELSDFSRVFEVLERKKKEAQIFLSDVKEFSDTSQKSLRVEEKRVSAKDSAKKKTVEDLKDIIERLKSAERDVYTRNAYDYYYRLFERIQQSNAPDKSLSAVDFRFIVNQFSYVLSRFSDVPSYITREELKALETCRKVVYSLAKERKYNPDDYTERTIEKALKFVYGKNERFKGIGLQRLERLLREFSKKARGKVYNLRK